MPVSQRRFLLCSQDVVAYDQLYKYPNQHIIGEVLRLKLDGETVTALALWLVPVTTSKVPPIQPETVVTLLGEGRGMRCRYSGGGVVCSRTINWYADKAAVMASFERLMARYPEGKKVMEQGNG